MTVVLNVFGCSCMWKVARHNQFHIQSFLCTSLNDATLPLLIYNEGALQNLKMSRQH